jgi:hypothetical protein
MHGVGAAHRLQKHALAQAAPPHADRLPPHVLPWSPATRLAPWNASSYAALLNCSHVHTLLRSLPSDSPADPRWESPWADYVDAIYGGSAAGKVDARRFSLLRGLAIRNATHRVTDRNPWVCSSVTVSNVRAQGARAILVWHRSGPLSRETFSQDNEWLEVYRSDYDQFNPEGLGCALHLSLTPLSGVH